ncbi:MAG: hypothetical protein ACOVQG_02110 [Crocinitomicaceae bacterium]|jgi:hypothetical protein
MISRTNKFFLISHITFSIGWLGAIAVFIVLAVKGFNTSDKQIAQSTIMALEVSAWYVILPFCIASLITGLIQASITQWGLFKYYWIVVKLILTLAMTILLILHLQPISSLANSANNHTPESLNDSKTLLDLITKAGLAILALVAITTISIYKPWGKIQNIKQQNMKNNKKSTSFYLLVGLVGIIIIVLITHLVGGGFRGH